MLLNTVSYDPGPVLFEYPREWLIVNIDSYRVNI